jgi:hypothetical protein
MMRISTRLSLFFLLLTIFSQTSWAQNAARQPTVAGGDIIVYVDAADNSGTAEFSLFNDSDLKISAIMHVDEFQLTNQAGDNKSSAVAVFRNKDDSEYFPVLKKDIEPGGTISVKLEIRNFLDAGEASASLLNKDVEIGRIIAIKRNIPFSLELVTDDPNQPELTIEHEKPVVLLVQNDDTMTYPVEIKLIDVQNATIIGESAAIAVARSITQVELKPSYNQPFRWFTGLYKDQELEAKLVFRFDAKGRIDKFYPPMKSIPLKLNIQYYSKSGKNLIGNLLILIVLLSGGFCSLFLNLWIPNKMKRIKLLSQIELLARETSKISLNVDSALRVGIRVDRLRISQNIRTVWILNTDAPTIYKGYENGLNLLKTRIELIKKLGRVAETLNSYLHSVKGAPVCILDDIHDLLEKATNILKTEAIEEADFNEANNLIVSAGESLENIEGDKPELAERFANSVVKLEKVYDSIKNYPKYDELKPQLKELFDLFSNPEFKKKAKIFPYHYHWLSSTIEALYILRHYILLFEAATSEKQHIMQEHEGPLIEYLRIKTWYAIRRARQLRYELHQGIFTDMVEKELAEKKVSIIVEPYQPLPNQLVRLSAQFNKQEFQKCAAQQEFTCIWDFGAIGKEEGWSISHYFRNEKEAAFEVQFRKPDGELVKDADQNIVEIAPEAFQLKKAERRGFGERAKIEAIWLFVALFIAIIALIAGAREQILKLDAFSGLVAVFLIGFGADTVKNLFSAGSPKDT